MSNEQQPVKPDDLQITIKQLIPFIVYTCLFVIFLLPFADDIPVLKYVSICTVLGHFSALIKKTIKR